RGGAPARPAHAPSRPEAAGGHPEEVGGAARGMEAEKPRRRLKVARSDRHQPLLSGGSAGSGFLSLASQPLSDFGTDRIHVEGGAQSPLGLLVPDVYVPS